VVERLILPEGLTRPAQQFIGLFRGDSLHELGDLRSAGSGVNQKVDVIRHHDKRDEVVQGPDSLATPNGFRDAFGHLRIFESAGAGRCAIKLAVGCNEDTSVADGSQGEGAVQSKGDKQRSSVGLKVGKIAAVSQMILVLRTPVISSVFSTAQAKACATCHQYPASAWWHRHLRNPSQGAPPGPVGRAPTRQPFHEPKTGSTRIPQNQDLRDRPHTPRGLDAASEIALA